MDPLSASASLVGLLQGIAVLVDYLKDFKTGGEQRQRLLDEVTSLWVVLTHLGENIQRTTPSSEHSTALSNLREPNGVLEQCRKVVEELTDRLQPGKKTSEKILQKLQWSFTKDEVQRKIDQLHRLQTTINGALAHATLSLSEKILDHSIISRTLLEEQEFQAIRKWLSPSNSLAQHTAISSSHCPGTGSAFLQSSQFQQWSNNPRQIFWCRGAPGTGKTYLSSIAANYLRSTFPEALVLVAHFRYDDPDSQKLENICGDLLRQSLSKNEVPEILLQIYRASQASGTSIRVEDALEILSERIVHRGKAFIILDALDEVLDLHSREKLIDVAHPEKIGASLLVTSRPLEDVQKSLGPAGHVCDGCQTTSLGSYYVHHPRFHRCFGGCDIDVCQPCYDSGFRCRDTKHAGLMKLVKHNYGFTVWAYPEDVQRYVEWRIESDASIHIILASRPQLRKELVDAAMDETMSLFLLARLLMDNLGQCLTAKRLRQTLQEVPKTLSSAYESTICRIDQQHPEWSHAAYETMAWITFAKRPLHVDEIEHAIAMNLTSHEFDIDDIVPGQRLVDLCCGLVTIDVSRRCRFVHPTVQDHLTQILKKRLDGAEILIAKKCLYYLQLQHLEHGPCDIKNEFEARLVEYPFLRYCCPYWALHLQEAQDQATLCSAETFLGKTAYWQSAYQVGYYYATSTLLSLAEASASSVLHYAAAVGAASSLDAPVRRRRLDPNITNERKFTPLMSAAYAGQSSCVKKLLELGADPNLQCSNGKTALHLATEQGKLESVVALIDSSAIDLDILDGQGDCALTKSINLANENIALLLIEAGADVTAGVDERGNLPCISKKIPSRVSPLMIAVSNGQLNIVRRMLDRKETDVNYRITRWGKTALVIAIQCGWVDIALLLLEQENIEVGLVTYSYEQARKGWTAIFYAVDLGDESIINALLARGASTCITSEAGATPLLIAARRNHISILRLILEAQDRANPQPLKRWLDSRNYNTLPASSGSGPSFSEDRKHERSVALLIAVHWGNKDMVELLLQYGATINLPDQKNGFTGVEYAIYWNNLEILDLLFVFKPEHPLLLKRGLPMRFSKDELKLPTAMSALKVEDEASMLAPFTALT